MNIHATRASWSLRTATRTVVRRAALCALVMSGAGCGGGATTPSTALPFVIAARSDTPYVSGVVSRIDLGDGQTLRIQVRARDTNASASRVPEAVVTVASDSLLLWRDGRKARLQDVIVNRAITVWVRGPELRSLPPQVTGSAILLDR